MAFLRSLLSKTRSSTPRASVAASLANDVNKAITLLQTASCDIDNEDALNLLMENGISKNEAEEILLFLPTAFVRHLLPAIVWPDFYFEMRGDKQLKKNFKDSLSYQVMWHETQQHFNKSFNSSNILKIAGRSAEFHAINDLLLKGGDLKNVNVTPTVILR